MPGLHKIGSAKDVEERRRLLSSYTAVPASFKIEALYSCSESQVLEDELQSLFSEYRYNPDREFFQLEIQTMKQIIREYLMIKEGDYTCREFKETDVMHKEWIVKRSKIYNELETIVKNHSGIFGFSEQEFKSENDMFDLVHSESKEIVGMYDMFYFSQFYEIAYPSCSWYNIFVELFSECQIVYFSFLNRFMYRDNSYGNRILTHRDETTHRVLIPKLCDTISKFEKQIISDVWNRLNPPRNV